MSGPSHRASAERVLVFKSSGYADAAARHITSALQSTIQLRGSCTLGLTGGDTPRPIYECMASPQFAQRIAWDRVAVYFGDERCVPPDDPGSNYGMARDALLSRLPIPHASIHRMECEHVDREAAARDYERLLPEKLDILLLGVGADGHTASLFPHSPLIGERDRRVVPASGPEPWPLRMTITPPVIQAAESVLVLAAGSSKAGAVRRALEGSYSPDAVPIQLALGGTWLIDTAAAAELSEAARLPVPDEDRSHR